MIDPLFILYFSSTLSSYSKVAKALPPYEIEASARLFRDIDKDSIFLFSFHYLQIPLIFKILFVVYSCAVDSGSISIDELMVAFDARGVPMKDIKSLMNQLDVEGTKNINYDQFISGAVSHSIASSEETLQLAFNLFDTDNR